MPDNQLSEFSMIPQAIGDELIALGEQISADTWRIGDLVNQAYEIVLANEKDVTKMQICAWAGRKVGKSTRNVRGYSYVSAFYPVEVRKEYDALPFSHFKFAMGFPMADNGVPGWKRVLDRSVEYMGERGFPPSVDSLERAFQSQIDDHNEKLHHGELPPPPVTAELTARPATATNPGGEDGEISWVPIIEGMADSMPGYAGVADPGDDEEGGGATEEAIEQLTDQLKDIVGKIFTQIPPMLNLLDIMGSYPELEWTKYFRIETAKVGIRMRQISEMVDKMRGRVDGVFLPMDDAEIIRDDTETPSPTPEEAPESENV